MGATVMGGYSIQPPDSSGYTIQPPEQKEQPNAAYRALQGVAEGLKNMVMGLPVTAYQAGKSAAEFTQEHPVLSKIPGLSVAAGLYDTLYSNPRDAAIAHMEEVAKQHGTQVPLAGKVLANIPIAGPMALGLGEKAASGDVAGALGEAVTYALAPEVVPRITAGARDFLASKAPGMYQSALKPSTTLGPSRVAGIINTGLKEGIPVSEAGVQKLASLIDDTNDAIANVIAQRPNAPINPNRVAQRTLSTESRFGKQVNPEQDLAAIQSSRQEFLANQGARPAVPSIPPQPTGLLDQFGKPIMNQGTPGIPAQPAPPMRAEDAQAMKQGTYAQLKSKSYGELKSASVESQKALARGLKEEIANQFPEIRDLNARDSELYDLQPSLERAVTRIANREPIGIGTPLMGAGVKAATGSTGGAAVAAFLNQIINMPEVKSRLAIRLAKGAGISPSAATARITALSESLGKSSSVASSAPASGQNNEPYALQGNQQ